MPTINVLRDDLFAGLGVKYTDEQFRKLCFDFGIELGQVTSEKEMVASEQGEQAAVGLSDEVIYKIEVPANRNDLLCLEGIVRALRIFEGKEKVPEYRVKVPAGAPGMIEMRVLKETSQVRPYVVCAVLRGVTLDDKRYKSFLDLQDKLHTNVCRRRTLVAIGTHDLDTLTPPFTYEARNPNDIKFVPLNEDKEFTAKGLFDYYGEEKKESHLKPYLPIIANSPVFPVIYDSKRVVLSLPPIINSEHSKITLKTRNVFIECTATDYTKATVVLNTMVAMFSQYCAEPFSAEAVRVSYEDHNGFGTHVLPLLEKRVFHTDIDYLNNGVGVDLSMAQILEMLRRMQLPAEADGDKKLKVHVPCTRSDVLHACDIQEDVAIAYGYNNIVKTVPRSATVGKEFPLNKLSDQNRNVLAQAGCLEVLTWALVNRKDNFDNMNSVDDGKTAAVLRPPVAEDFQVVRTSLLPCLFKAVGKNKGQVSLPFRVFEVSDVVLLDNSRDVGARNERRIAAVYGGTTSGFEFIHGLVDRVLTQNECVFVQDKHEMEEKKKRPDYVEDPDEKERVPRFVYSTIPSNRPAFFPKRQAEIFLEGRKEPIGVFGVVHPQVLANFGIDHPCSALEINLEVFL